jgi:hypothetical protein
MTTLKVKYAPSVYLIPEALEKIDTWCKIAKEEVSGLGLVQIDKDGDLFVTDVFLLKQESGTAHTELSQEAIGGLISELRKKKIPGSQLKFWWHWKHGLRW